MVSLVFSKHLLKVLVPHILVFCVFILNATNNAYGIQPIKDPEGYLEEPCEIALTDIRNLLENLQPFQAVQWQLGKDARTSRIVRGRVYKNEAHYIHLHTISDDGKLKQEIFLKDKLTTSILRWHLPSADALQKLDNTLRYCSLFSESENLTYSNQCLREDEQRHLVYANVRRERRAQFHKTTLMLNADDLPNTNAVVGIKDGRDARPEYIRLQSLNPSLVYRSLASDSASKSITADQTVEIQFTDTEQILWGHIVAAAPLVVKINLIKPHGIQVWGLVWLDASKIKSIRPTKFNTAELSKGQIVHWIFKESVRGLHSLSGRVLELSSDGRVIVCGIDSQGIHRRWCFSPEELQHAEPANYSATL